MKKEAVIFFLIVLIIPIVNAGIDTGIKKITHHAEEYEIGNINYAQLIVYTTSLSQELAEEMGATTQGHDAVLKAEQLRSVLGEPTETTKWVWVENEEREKKLDEEIPAWRKIIFDGKKIQIWLDAWPNIISKDDKDLVFYRLHLDIRFKKPEEQIDIETKIEEIKGLAERYNENPISENLETLAQESVNAEQLFSSHFNQNPGKCEEVMNDIFGSENKRDDQKLLQQEIEFYERDNFEATFMLEMCDECEWHWINLHIEFEIHQRFDYGYIGDLLGSKERFNSLTSEDFKKETVDLVENIRGKLDEGDYKGALEIVHELRILTEAWNEKANNVWEEVEDKFRIDWESMTEEERRECQENYCWIKKEQEKREAGKNLRNSNYEDRKIFYLDLFSNYEKKEFYYEQEEWEKRLIEEFKEFGEEICNNGIDDNENEELDCSEAQCGGKLCGYDKIIAEEGNETREIEIELYCIAGTCQAKEEVIEKQEIICGNHICEEGEDGENGTCFEDCALCVEHNPILCGGSVIFSGKNESGCLLEPICLEEEEFCEVDEDCTQLLCANVGCVEGVCQVIELAECRDPECVDGTEKIKNCENGDEVIFNKCVNGIWKDTGVKCEIKEDDLGCVPCGNNCLPKGDIASALCPETTEDFDCIEINGECAISQVEIDEEEVGDECIVRTDCGNENDVCSNGQCVTLPEAIERDEEIGEEIEEEIEGEEIEEEEAGEEEEQEEIEEGREEVAEAEEAEEEIEGEVSEEKSGLEPEAKQQIATGNVILGFLRNLVNKLAITGFAVEDGTTETPIDKKSEEPPLEEPIEEIPKEPDVKIEEEQKGEERIDELPKNEFEENFDYEREDEREERERREREEQERRKNECGERCKRECYERVVRPCAEDCIWEECGNELECNVDEVKIKCENKCGTENNLESCEKECFDKCLAGEETWIEPEREEHKEEKFVFTIGGSCRESKGKSEGFIWFGGWGENFDDFHLIKNKYYSQEGGGDWCEEDLEDLIKQREELENSLNEEFAYWFFEKYVANAADDWEKHISGIFELYWRDVDISRQMSERLQCLKKDGLPEHKLINFEYDTDYGSVEFWEEVKTVKLDENSEEVQIISPYMKTWLFPSREFFKSEMRRAMERHEMPGPSEEEKKSALTEDEKREIRHDSEFIETIKEFNEEYGENLVIQFKDFETDEIAFNVYIRLNEEEIMYFEPMPPSENPAEDVRIEFDVDKLLDIIEYEESGRIELESPPWDRKPSVGFVKNVVNGVRMFFMFRDLMNSAVVHPDSAKNDVQSFVRNFFEIAMGGGGDHEDREDFEEFDEENLPEGWEDKEFLTGEVIRR